MRVSNRVPTAPRPARAADTVAIPARRPTRARDTLATPPARPLRPTEPVPPTRPAGPDAERTTRPGAPARAESEEERGSRGWELTLLRHLTYPRPRD